jgi:hypothetical protein
MDRDEFLKLVPEDQREQVDRASREAAIEAQHAGRPAPNWDEWARAYRDDDDDDGGEPENVESASRAGLGDGPIPPIAPPASEDARESERRQFAQRFVDLLNREPREDEYPEHLRKTTGEDDRGMFAPGVTP